MSQLFSPKYTYNQYNRLKIQIQIQMNDHHYHFKKKSYNGDQYKH